MVVVPHLSSYRDVQMSAKQRRKVLIRLLANFDQQIADAKALLIEVPENSSDAEAARLWLNEAQDSAIRTHERLAELDGD
jgi:hypothetical protein